MTVRFMIPDSLLNSAQAARQPGPAVTWSARAPEPFRNASDGTTECQSASGMVLAQPGVSVRGESTGEASYWFRGDRPLCCHAGSLLVIPRRLPVPRRLGAGSHDCTPTQPAPERPRPGGPRRHRACISPGLAVRAARPGLTDARLLDLGQLAGRDVEDETAHGIGVRDERAGLDPRDRLPDISVEVVE